MKLRTGRASDKEQLLAMLETCYTQANSKDDFFENIKECGLKTYERSGTMTGVWYENKKFRFSRLGYTREKLEDLEAGMKKSREIQKLRKEKQVKQKDIGKGR